MSEDLTWEKIPFEEFVGGKVEYEKRHAVYRTVGRGYTRRTEYVRRDDLRFRAVIQQIHFDGRYVTIEVQDTHRSSDNNPKWSKVEDPKYFFLDLEQFLFLLPDDDGSYAAHVPFGDTCTIYPYACVP